jgi:flavorubredoxin
MITNTQSGTNIHEIIDGIFRINTPIMMPGSSGQFNFNQYLIVDEAPLLFHTGLRRLFPLVREAVAQVMAIERLRYVTISHFEADECGSLNEWLAVAPEAEPLCSRIGAMVSIGDIADRAPRSMTDGEILTLGKHTVRWFDTPHMPHAWDCGMMMEGFTRTLLCGDLFTQGGSGKKPVVETDILGPSEAFRAPMDYYAHAPNTTAILERLAQERPAMLACMHGSAWRGDGAALLLALEEKVSGMR